MANPPMDQQPLSPSSTAREILSPSVRLTRTLTTFPSGRALPGGKRNEGLVMMPYKLDKDDFKQWLGQSGSDDAFAQRRIDSYRRAEVNALCGRLTVEVVHS